jgi:predicted kinase
VTVLYGLPGAGKDTHFRMNFLIGLKSRWIDGANASKSHPLQGQVIQAARKEAREHLRTKRRFIWNATNVSRLHRHKAIRLASTTTLLSRFHAFDRHRIGCSLKIEVAKHAFLKP